MKSYDDFKVGNFVRVQKNNRSDLCYGVIMKVVNIYNGDKAYKVKIQESFKEEIVTVMSPL